MLDITRSDERYNLKTDWLNAYWHFSFDHYHDPTRMGFGPLRVFNNDTIQPGRGFPTHPHRDMEIVTYVIDGALEHKDSTGGAGVIRAGEAQRMSAGQGVFHSEFNASKTDPVELVQIWILPTRKGGDPNYEQKRFSVEERTGKLLPIVAPDGAASALTIGQDATIYVSRLEPGGEATLSLDPGRRAYVFTIAGEPVLNGEKLAKGDSARATEPDELRFTTAHGSEVLVIEMP